MFVVGIERFLRRPERFRHVLQVDADARPGLEAAAHRVDEHVGRLEVRRRLGMPRLPALEARERVVLLSARGRSRSADASPRRAAPWRAARRLHARRLRPAACW